MEESQQAREQKDGLPFGSQLPAATAANMKTSGERRAGPWDMVNVFPNASPPRASKKEVPKDVNTRVIILGKLMPTRRWM